MVNIGLRLRKYDIVQCTECAFHKMSKDVKFMRDQCNKVGVCRLSFSLIYK